jgi:N-acetylglucosamine-6-phosphate deacetylase
MKKFENAKIFTEEGFVTSDLVFDEKIVSIGKLCADEVIALPEGALVLPGFIDQHIHGAGGSDAMDGTAEDLATIAETVAKEGTVAFLATTMTQSEENITSALYAVKNYISENRDTGAEILGVHLEGPFIAPAHKGAQPGEYIATPDVSVFDKYNEASGNNIKIVTLAPETTGACELISHLCSINVVASIGHSSAKFTDVEAAYASGAKNVTHTFNAQSPLHHREVGVVGAAMQRDKANILRLASGFI